MSYQETITYDTSTGANGLSFNTSYVEVASNTLRLKDQGGGTYVTTNPTVTTQHINVMSALSSFSESTSAPTGSATGYTIQINGINYWYNATDTAWEVANGTYAQSNTASVINTNASTLFSSLNIIQPANVCLTIFLNSNGTVRPAITSNTLGYSFTNNNPVAPSQCLLYAYVNDLLGNIPTISTTQPITLNVTGYTSFFYNGTLILPFTKSVTFNATTGYAQLSVIETTTPGVALEFSISYFDGISQVNVKLFNAIVPNQSSCQLSTITRPRNIDFG